MQKYINERVYVLYRIFHNRFGGLDKWSENHTSNKQ